MNYSGKLAQFLYVMLVVAGLLAMFNNNAYAATFTEPVVSPNFGTAGAADPWVIYQDGYYYYCKSLYDNAIGVAKAKRLQDIGLMPMVTVFTPPAGTDHSKAIWAPELHFLDGKWYIYFTASDGDIDKQRVHVLESDSPQGTYTYKGRITPVPDEWAIDGTVLELRGKKYLVWSGWEGKENVIQRLYIAPLSNPWTLSGPRVEISKPDYDWEKVGSPDVNEGPEILTHNGKVFIIYSASGCWTDSYCLGQLELTGSDPLKKESWTKKPTPVFSHEPGAYGTGHASFTKSPDGKEDWLVYHAFQYSSGREPNRSVRAQKFTWDKDGYPVFGTPLPFGAVVEEPSGTPPVEGLSFEPGKFYKLINGATQRCLSVVYLSSRPGASVTELGDINSNEQKWRFVPAGEGYYKVVAKVENGELCLDAPEAATAPEAHVFRKADVTLNPDNGSFTQQWKIVDMGNGFFQLVNRAGKANTTLHAEGGSPSPGARIILWPHNNAPAQMWKIEFADY